MNPYDHAAVSAVWQRVTQERQADCLETALSTAIADEHRAHRTYLAMAKCGYAELFRHIASQEVCHAHKLSALYFLLYGCPPCKKDACLPKICNFCEAVRTAYAGELEAARIYRELAKRHPEHEQLFCSIAQAEQRHACLLCALAERLICKS